MARKLGHRPAEPRQVSSKPDLGPKLRQLCKGLGFGLLKAAEQANITPQNQGRARAVQHRFFEERPGCGSHARRLEPEPQGSDGLKKICITVFGGQLVCNGFSKPPAQLPLHCHDAATNPSCPDRA
jgi:hypothetical protein